MDLSHEDSGTERDVPVGEHIEVRLPENPTTGYRWHADVDEAALRKTHDAYEGAAEPRGAGGTRIMRFEALRPGTVVLHLVKRRSWEQKPTDEFTVQLSVSPPA
jgi:inhibitor of cysteine peptidase